MRNIGITAGWGGVVECHRGRGIARRLMTLQHEWAAHQNFRTVETLTRNTNTAMVGLNQSVGFVVMGVREKHGAPYLVFEKSLTGLAP